MWMVLLPAFTLGCISSFHCLGMCGPLALALPVQHLTLSKRRLAVALYQTGRIVTYTLLGCIVGLFGRSVNFAAFQQLFSIIAGVAILALLAAQTLLKFTNSDTQSLFAFIQQAMQLLWKQTNMVKFLFIGSLNGLLPCGMVYFALIATLSLASVQASMLFMVAFGAGTLPMMVSLHLLGVGYLGMQVRNAMRKMVPYLVAMMGVLLIARGLNLGIPFISPSIAVNTNVISCH
jgi:sulfite exporter TauE/SafE